MSVLSCEWLYGLLNGDYDFTEYSRKNARAELAALRADLATVTAERDASRAAENHWQEIAKSENDTANNLRDTVSKLNTQLATYQRMAAVRQ